MLDSPIKLKPVSKLNKRIAKKYIGHPIFFRQISTGCVFWDARIESALSKRFNVYCDGIGDTRTILYTDIDNVVVYVSG